MFVLALDTSTPAVTAAVVTVPDTDEPVLAAVRAPLNARGHGELLAPSLADAVAEAGIGVGDLGAIVAGLGPGPYTGLRVGLVTAAVMADLLAIPVYGVCSLDAIAAACASEPSLLVASDARRREVYWARYARGVREGDPQVDRPADVPLDGVGAVAGAGGELYADVWDGLPVLPRRYPDPVGMVRLALDRISGGAPAEALTPLYLRRPDATVPGAPKAALQ